MDETKNISELEETVARDRSRYIASGEKDWHRLAMALRALSERYSCEGLYEKAGECDAERAGKEDWGPSGINWGFIAELCRTLIKQ